MKRNCSLCGNKCYQVKAFKAGYVCEPCIKYVKTKKTNQNDLKTGSEKDDTSQNFI